MKKLIIFFAFASLISNAQSRFIKLDSAQLIKHVESFIWLTEVNYVADKIVLTGVTKITNLLILKMKKICLQRYRISRQWKCLCIYRC